MTSTEAAPGELHRETSLGSTNPDVDAHGPVRARSGPARMFLGSRDDPTWARPLWWLLLVGTGALYVIDLSASGYANDFYAAAVKSATESWKAWLFASLDSGNAITVDKPPAAMWVMGLSARIFGFSSFSMLLPQALMGVGTVMLTHATVRRWSGPAAGLVAGVLVALTPVAALMFRFNNPDALLVLLMTAATYFVVRALERDGGRGALKWLLLAGTALGFAFLTKMLQGLLVLPAFGLVYLVAAPARLWTRIWQLLAAAGALIVSAGWFFALVALWPADARPYIGGSTDNSLWELAIGYNGLGRIFGQGGGTSSTGAGPAGAGGGGGGGGPGGPGSGGFAGAPGGGGFGGQTGLTRLFSTSFGAQISWLLPAALIGLLAGFWFTRRAARTDRIRAAMLLWGGSLLTTALVFSYMSGIIHPYYTVALAPLIAAPIAISGRELWRARSQYLARASLAAMIAVTAGWSWVLLGRDAPDWLPWLRWVVLIGGLAGPTLLAVPAASARRLAVVALTVGSLCAVGGTTGFTVATAAIPHTGSIPTAGPASLEGGSGGAPGGFGNRAERSGAGGFGPGGPGATESGNDNAPNGSGNATSSDELVALLNATTTRWSAAVIGAQSADGYILSSHTAVMAIGGFSGGDAYPTLAQFQQYVAHGEISYFIAGGGRGGPGGGNSEISSWVADNFTANSVGGATVYDLRAPAG